MWTVCAAGTALMIRNPWYLVGLAAVTLLVGWRLDGKPPGRGTLYLVLGLVGSSMLVNLLFSRAGETVLLEFAIPWLGGPYTLEALLFGVSAGVQVATLLLVMGVFSRALTAADLLRRTPRGLYPVGLASTLGLSFAPHARQSFVDLREAQQLRGQSHARGRNSLRLVTSLVVVALERAVAQAEALAARGWGRESPAGNHRWEGALAWLAIGASVLLCAATPQRALLALVLLLTAAGVHWTALRRRESSTRYRPEPWQRRDTFVTVAAGVAVIGLILLAAREPGALGYYPYPKATLPPLSIAPLVAVAFLAAPALVVGPSTQMRPRRAPQEDPRGSMANRAETQPGAARAANPRRHAFEDVAKGKILLEAVRFTYPEAVRPALDGIDLMVEPGERILLGGVSGSGKSTLLRVINGLVPHFYGGRFGGRAFISGADTRTSSPQGLAATVGTVFQDLPARFLTGAVEDEIAFSLELAQLDARRIPARVAEISERMGVARLSDRRLEKLSAGEQARLAVAAAAARRPDILLLDEPVTHIDPAGARAAVEWVRQLSQEEGVTVLVAEHRDENWQDDAQRVVQLGSGRLWLEKGMADSAPGAEPELAELVGRVSPTTLVARNLHLNLDGVGVLQGADMAVRPGELLALVGRNGSGKTTLLRCLVGLARPDAGEILLNGNSVKGRSLRETASWIGYVPQAPSSMLFADTVEEEISQTLASRATGEAPEEVDRWLAAFGLTSLAGSYPRDLSAGERQRVALAAVLAGRPPIVLLDEPTLGMDRRRMAWLGRGLERLCRAGCAVVVATHDVAFVAEYATHAVMLAAGRIIAEGNPRSVLDSDPAFAQAHARWRAHLRAAARLGQETTTAAVGRARRDLADR